MNNQQPGQPVSWLGVTLTLFKLVFLCVSVISGFPGFIYFAYARNFYAAGACFKMEFVCYHVSRLNTTAIEGELREKYTRCELWCIFASAIVVGVVSYVEAVGCAALGGIYNQGFQMEEDGYYVCVVPCSVALLWSMVLAADARSCMRDLREGPGDTDPLHTTGLRRF